MSKKSQISSKEIIERLAKNATTAKEEMNAMLMNLDLKRTAKADIEQYNRYCAKMRKINPKFKEYLSSSDESDDYDNYDDEEDY